jgi:hypothetical protein
MSLADAVQSIASLATAIGVGLAAWQLRLTKQQAQSEFEDRLNEQYRKVAARIPLAALLGRPLDDDELTSSLRAFYDYFDLSNEQAFLHTHGRVRAETWQNWCEGIQQHLCRPAFRGAWERLLPDLDGSFDDLRQLIAQW